MPDQWMPGVTRADTGRRLSMRGGPALFTWHTFEAPYSYSPDLRAAVRYLSSQRSDPHFVFHPITGALVQMLPASTGGRTLRAPGVNTNTHGRTHMQVEVIAYASRPWTQDLTAAGAHTLSQLLEFLRSWDIPDRWSHGVRPPRYPGGRVIRRQPTQSGHFHHAGWVGNDHGDPGAIADPWSLTPQSPAPPTDEEEFDMSDAQYRELKAQQDEILNVLNHHIGLKLTKAEKRDLGTNRDLALKQLVTLDAKRTKTLMDRQWDVIKATDDVVDALTRRGLSVDDAARADITAALREA